MSVLDPQVRRVLTREQALAVGRQLLDMMHSTKDDGGPAGVQLVHTARSITKISNGRVLESRDGDDVQIAFSAQFGSGLPVMVHTNQLEESMLHQLARRVAAMAPAKPVPAEAGPVDYSATEPFTFQARPIPPVALWHETTAQAMGTVQGDVIAGLADQLHTSTLNGAATVMLTERSVLYLYRQGLTSFAEETDSEVTVTARTPDNTVSGWAGQANRDWAQIKPAAVASRAIELAERGRGVVALEPGRRTAILGPAAVAQLVRNMAREFDWVQTKNGATPFAYSDRDRVGHGRQTQFGLRVFDPRLMMVSDPADPMGGYPPFFEEGNFVEFSIQGYPTPAVTWVDHGVLTQFAYSVPDSLVRKMTACDWPLSVRLMAVPGTPTATVDEMIAQCQEGLYVNRLSFVDLIDWPGGIMTGVTSDGCFLVKNGKIEKSVKNFRFMESPILAFNRIEMIGAPERVAFGYNSPRGGGEWIRQPRLPMIVPPLMIRDFNFVALSDAT